LAEKYNKFLPKKDLQRSEVFQWLFFQMANVGPIVGQLYAFQHLMPEKSELTIKRFTLETIRIIKVLDDRLANRNYLCDEYSIADIATYPWVVTLGIVDISIDEFPHLKAWVEHIGKRPAVQKGMTLPEVDLSFEERLKIVKALGGDFVTGA
jgi:GST-like protein